jgi:2-keto-3-deoxy-L-rhamnonate aldolase RhmA
VRGNETTPLVRVNWNDIVQIKRALDIGAYGVMVPWVNTKEEAEIAVKATRYAPKGLRGCGPRRASMFDPDYLKTADEEILVVCQIETKKAVENIEEIASVEGVDVTYIGPADLSASYGHLGNMSHPEVQEAIDRVYDATRAAGKATGVHLASGKTIKERMEKGYDFITIGNDFSLLRRGVRELLVELNLNNRGK